MKTTKNSTLTALAGIFCIILGILPSIFLSKPTTARAAGTEPAILETNVEQASRGCVLVGIEGSYLADVQAALDRINALRYEACVEGLRNPADPSKALTTADYVPIQWSSGLEYIARLRAAEAIVCHGHGRPNNSGCFTLTAPDGTGSREETLAFNAASMVSGINLWYAEKAEWVAQNEKAETGHYTSMIDPSNRYIGLGAFYSGFGEWNVCVCGEFSKSNKSGSSVSEGTEDCIQKIEIRKSFIKGLKILYNDWGLIEPIDSVTLKPGKQKNLFARLYVYAGVSYAYCNDLAGISWTSSDPSIVKVDNSGSITGEKPGTAEITATTEDGLSASCQVTVEKVQLYNNNVSLSQERLVYNGSARKPDVIVTFMDEEQEKTVDPSFYTVKYPAGCKNIGRYTVTVTMKGNYRGTLKTDFLIVPKGTTVTSLKIGKGTINLKWKKQTQHTDGYCIELSEKKSIPSSDKTTIYFHGNKNTTTVVDELKRNQTYYVRFGTFKQINGEKIESEYTKIKCIKTK